MEEQRFDDLTRLVAQKTSRRQMLKVLAGAAVGGIFAGRLSPTWASSTRSSCAQFCNATFGKDTPATSQCLKDGKNNPNALCNSACNGSGGTLCGPQSGGYYTGYAGTTCCTSTQTCSTSSYTCLSPVTCNYANAYGFAGGTVVCGPNETCDSGFFGGSACTCGCGVQEQCDCPDGLFCYQGHCVPVGLF